MNDIIYKHFLNKKNKYWEDYGEEFIKSELSKFNAITINISNDSIVLKNSFNGILTFIVNDSDIIVKYDSETEFGGYSLEFHNCPPLEDNIVNKNNFAKVEITKTLNGETFISIKKYRDAELISTSKLVNPIKNHIIINKLKSCPSYAIKTIDEYSPA